MFIKSLKIKNFGAVRDASYKLENGVIVVRGSNAVGKTTSFSQAPLYAMFGTSTLDASLAETVTRGENPNALSVELTIGPYTVKRSKTAASVVGSGIQITGQEDVSSFFYQLLGVRKGLEEAILVALQGETAGLVTKRPAEVTTLIEGLAGFEQIDALIDKVKDNYPSGQKQVLEDNIINLEARQEELSEVVLAAPGGLEKEIKELAYAIELNNKTIYKLNGKKDEASATIASIDYNNKCIRDKSTAIGRAKLDIENTNREIQKLRYVKIPVFEPSVIQKYNKLIANSVEANKLSEVYKKLQALEYPEDIWEGSLESFQVELSSAAKAVKDRDAFLAVTKANLAKESKELANVGSQKVCTKCGQDVQHLHKDLIVTLETEIKELANSSNQAENRLIEEKQYLAALNSINNAQIRVQKVASTSIEIDETVVPHRLSWVGEPPVRVDQETINKASQYLKDYAEACKLEEGVTKAIESKEAALKTLNTRIDELIKELVVFGEEKSIVSLTVELDKTKKFITNIEGQVTEARKELTTKHQQLTKLLTDIDYHAKETSRVAEELKEVRVKLKRDNRNAKLLKSVRDAKPKVLDLVWTRLLTAVSQTYSEMFGKEMTVEKKDNGFYVNGSTVKRASGAEKSTLGLAMRGTLRDIFSPSCGFMMLDEPFSNMDVNTTATTAGALYNIRGQKIIISHEDNTEMAADQIVEVV